MFRRAVSSLKFGQVLVAIIKKTSIHREQGIVIIFVNLLMAKNSRMLSKN